MLLQNAKYLSLASASGENTEVVRGGARENGRTRPMENMISRVKEIELPLEAHEGNDKAFK